MRLNVEYQDIDEPIDNSRRQRKLNVAAGILILFAVVGTMAALTQSNSGASIQKREAIGTLLDKQGIQVDSDMFFDIGDDHEIFVQDDADPDSFIHVNRMDVSEDYSVLRPFPIGGHLRWCSNAILYLMHQPSAHVIEKEVKIRNGMTSYKGKKVYVIIVPPVSQYYRGRYYSGKQVLYMTVHAICNPPPPMSTPRPPFGSTTTFRPQFTTPRRFFTTPRRFTTTRFPPFFTSPRRFTTTTFRPFFSTTTRRPFFSTTTRRPFFSTTTRRPFFTSHMGFLSTTTRRSFFSSRMGLDLDELERKTKQ